MLKISPFRSENTSQDPLLQSEQAHISLVSVVGYVLATIPGIAGTWLYWQTAFWGIRADHWRFLDAIVLPFRDNPWNLPLLILNQPPFEYPVSRLLLVVSELVVHLDYRLLGLSGVLALWAFWLFAVRYVLGFWRTRSQIEAQNGWPVVFKWIVVIAVSSLIFIPSPGGDPRFKWPLILEDRLNTVLAVFAITFFWRYVRYGKMVLLILGAVFLLFSGKPSVYLLLLFGIVIYPLMYFAAQGGGAWRRIIYIVLINIIIAAAYRIFEHPGYSSSTLSEALNNSIVVLVTVAISSVGSGIVPALSKVYFAASTGVGAIISISYFMATVWSICTYRKNLNSLSLLPLWIGLYLLPMIAFAGFIRTGGEFQTWPRHQVISALAIAFLLVVFVQLWLAATPGVLSRFLAGGIGAFSVLVIVIAASTVVREYRAIPPVRAFHNTEFVGIWKYRDELRGGRNPKCIRVVRGLCHLGVKRQLEILKFLKGSPSFMPIR